MIDKLCVMASLIASFCGGLFLGNFLGLGMGTSWFASLWPSFLWAESANRTRFQAFLCFWLRTQYTTCEIGNQPSSIRLELYLLQLLPLFLNMGSHLRICYRGHESLQHWSFKTTSMNMNNLRVQMFRCLAEVGIRRVQRYVPRKLCLCWTYADKVSKHLPSSGIFVLKAMACASSHFSSFSARSISWTRLEETIS